MNIRSIIPALALALFALLPGHARAAWLPSTCGPGSVMIGLAGNAGVWVDRLQALCGQWDPSSQRFNPTSPGQLLATSGGGSPEQVVCPAGSAVALIGQWLPKIGGQYVAENVELVCFKATSAHERTRVTFATTGSGRSDDGSYSGDLLPNGCKDGLATGFDANVATFVGEIAIRQHCAPWPAASLPRAPQGAMSGIDLPGNDIAGAPASTPADCAAACRANTRCQAWTWTSPGTKGMAQAMCFQKNPVPAQHSDACCISGTVPEHRVVQTGPVGADTSRVGGALSALPAGPAGSLSGYDRPYHDIGAAPSPSPSACAQACAGNPQCKAWTWTKPGTNGMALATCFQKNPAPAAVPNPCCVSSGNTTGFAPSVSPQQGLKFHKLPFPQTGNGLH